LDSILHRAISHVSCCFSTSERWCPCSVNRTCSKVAVKCRGRLDCRGKSKLVVQEIAATAIVTSHPTYHQPPTHANQLTHPITHDVFFLSTYLLVQDSRSASTFATSRDFATHRLGRSRWLHTSLNCQSDPHHCWLVLPDSQERLGFEAAA